MAPPTLSLLGTTFLHRRPRRGGVAAASVSRAWTTVGCVLCVAGCVYVRERTDLSLRGKKSSSLARSMS
ncbi:hypothetical protein PUN28_016393 [Cardiocondyla obscurior]|uniref:Uncharacterized protein n=1 Tax=Cardiocondyla obscurior TaxID=286306 RepID=A0AAW2EP04_9HYME